MNETNLVEIITETINTLLHNLFSSVENTTYELLDDLLFLDSSFLKDSFLTNLFNTNGNNTILVIANSLLLGFLLYYVIQYFLCSYTFLPIQRPYQFLFKILLTFIFMNASFFLCEKIIFLNSTLSSSIRNLGEILLHKEICFSSLLSEMNSIIAITEGNFNLFSIDGIIKSFISIGLFNLVLSYSLRYVMLKVFLLLSPFAILSLCLSSTSWFFKMWLRSFLSLLFLQVLIAIILLILFSMNFESSLLAKFIYIGGIYALTRANLFLKELIGGISTDIQFNFNLMRGTMH